MSRSTALVSLVALLGGVGCAGGPCVTQVLTRGLAPNRAALAARARDNGARDMRLPDPARERDARSLGVRSPSVSALGGALAGFGLGANVLFGIATGKTKLWSLGPLLHGGGGGIGFGGRF